MTEIIRLANQEDLPELLSIYANARSFMRASGNLTQWTDDYPGTELLLSDMGKNALYVLEKNGEILCVFALFDGEDPTYLHIDGAWMSNEPYLTIHRIASSGKESRIADRVFAWAYNRLPNLRIDTHEDNYPMQRCLARNGFVYCGVIYLENGDPRRAYQKTQ